MIIDNKIFIEQGLLYISVTFLCHPYQALPHFTSLLSVWSLTFQPLLQLCFASSPVVSIDLPASKLHAFMFFKTSVPNPWPADWYQSAAC